MGETLVAHEILRFDNMLKLLPRKGKNQQSRETACVCMCVGVCVDYDYVII